MTDREKCAHLLRRFGLGASEAEIDYYLRDGLNGAVDRLLDTSEDTGFGAAASDLVNDRGILPRQALEVWWASRLIGTHRPLREKMTLFWHDHFATSADKVTNVPLMVQQNELFRENSLSSFKTLLHQVSKDPAMLFWLDNNENVRGKPNENFAREVMELFTLGVDQGYTETDIREAARAFTGWSLQRVPEAIPGVRGGATFLYRAPRHDFGDKTVLGRTGDLSGEDVLDLLCERPRTAEFLTEKIWAWFVYRDPSPKTLAPFVKRFRDSGLDISFLLRDIMRSSDFYSEKAVRAVVKSPVDFCVSALRQLGYGAFMAERTRQLKEQQPDPTGRRLPRVALVPAQIAAQSMRNMGMQLFFPPDVAGWEGGPSWISSATMVERISFADRLFGASRQGKPALSFPALSLVQPNATPEAFVDRILSTFDATLRPERKATLVQAAAKELTRPLTRTSASAAAMSVTRLVFAAPEFQLA